MELKITKKELNILFTGISRKCEDAHSYLKSMRKAKDGHLAFNKCCKECGKNKLESHILMYKETKKYQTDYVNLLNRLHKKLLILHKKTCKV